MRLIRLTMVLGFMAAVLAFASDTPLQKSDSLKLILEKTSDPVVRASVLKQLSRISFESGDYIASIGYLNQEVGTHLSNNDSVSWANAQYSLGMVYSVVQNFDE
ncbi:MAG: hypothetical protein HGA37_16790, partial [Lentimicrobium sp.]|nr:hypothetical protein [Lentimicrobium sp.]